jgi:3-oxoacyl-[acyl-carrier-protein] synthase II
LSPASSSIVITGAGMVTPLGLTRRETWEAVVRGQCGFGPLGAMEQPLAQGKDGGQAPDLPSGKDDDEPADTPREVRYLRHALREALADAGFADGKLPYAPERCGLMIGTTLHGMRAGGEFLRTGGFAPLRNFLAASTLRAAARGLGVEGLAATTCSACSSSLGSVALAVTLLQSGQFDLILAGGYDPISEYVYGGFNSLRLVADGPLRPFTRGRQGMKLAEGYAIVVLERAQSARSRGNKPLATVLGFGESADAHHLTQPHPQGDGAARAMSDALHSANLAPADIDLIAAHATGTPDNDAAEFAAMSRVFGERLSEMPVVAFKSHLGHTLGGAGAVELILSAMALNEQTVPPCANVGAEDVEFAGLNLSIGRSKTMPIRATLNTSLGFGGANTCVILGPPVVATPASPRAEHVNSPQVTPASQRRSSPRRDVLITGIGIVLPGAIGNDAFLARLASRETRVTRDTGPIPESDIANLLNARRVRRMSDYVKLSLAATSLAFTDAGVTDVPAFTATCSAILGSTHGSANYSRDYYKQIVTDGIPAANPMLFAEGVPNAAAAHLSLMMSLKGACQTIIGSRTAGLDALRLAAERIAQGRWDRAVVSAGEEFCQTVNDAYRHCGLYAGEQASLPFGEMTGGGFAVGCGTITLILESRESADARGARPRGVVGAGATAFPAEGHEVAQAARVLHALGDPVAVLSSANGTWIDRVETAAAKVAARARGTGEPTLSTLCGYFAETFSVTPLLGVAAILLGRALPQTFGPTATDAAVSDLSGGAAVLSTDYTGTVCGVFVSPT